MTTVHYETEVVQVGSLVPEFVQTGLIILFSDIAPEELHDLAVLHHPSIQVRPPEPGDIVDLAGERFTITAVGSVAGENLMRLGHVSLKADGAAEAALPGDISVEVRPIPLLEPGSVVRFIAGSATQASKEPR